MSESREDCERAIAAVRAALAPYVFRVPNEASLQIQVAGVLALVAGLAIEREVFMSDGRGRLDLACRYVNVGAGCQVNMALELKTRSSATAVERQCQRYAKYPFVDAVCVVTTSQRLAAEIGDLRDLGGKPFYTITVRTT